jgi:superfamily II DNA helicase RecQ
MPWSMTDFAQASGRGGRGGETFDVVVMIEQGKVEKRIEQESGDIDVRLAISQVTQFELTELTAKTQFSQSVLKAAGRQSSQFRGHQTN